MIVLKYGTKRWAKMIDRGDTHFQSSITTSEIELTTALSFKETNFDVLFTLREERTAASI